MSEQQDDLPAHLELIQGVIERHARSSFLLKGWSVTLVAAVFLLAVRGSSPVLAMTAGLLPAITFWGLDAYYLTHERTYRALYDHVRKNGTKADDRFTMDAQPFKSGCPSWAKTLFSPSVLYFHLAIVLVVIGALAIFSLRTDHAA